jgi:microcystin-dependent protein
MNTSLVVRKPVLALAMAGLIGSAAWSPASLACGTEDYISSICAMASVTLRDFGNQFVVADGRTLAINQYSPLYALIGTTYGSQGSAYFKIPDLRGRSVIGAGQGPGLPVYQVGEVGGNSSFMLTAAQLPPHIHPLSAPVNISQMTATTTLSGLTASADLGGVKVSGPASGLTVNVSSDSNGGTTPTNNYLGKSGGLQGNLYASSATPGATLNAGSIGGNLSLTIASGTTAPVSINGNATTTLGGTATVTGNTGVSGSGQPVNFMPPYVAMKYYIAVTGLFPSND